MHKYKYSLPHLPLSLLGKAFQVGEVNRGGWRCWLASRRAAAIILRLIRQCRPGHGPVRIPQDAKRFPPAAKTGNSWLLADCRTLPPHVGCCRWRALPAAARFFTDQLFGLEIPILLSVVQSSVFLANPCLSNLVDCSQFQLL